MALGPGFDIGWRISGELFAEMQKRYREESATHGPLQMACAVRDLHWSWGMTLEQVAEISETPLEIVADLCGSHGRCLQCESCGEQVIVGRIDPTVTPQNWDPIIHCHECARQMRAMTKARSDEYELREAARVEHLQRMPYRDYLQTDHWRAMRLVALERDERRCRVCNSPDALNVHHRTYERLGREEPHDLTTLCADCHRMFHDNGKLVPAEEVTA